MVLKIRADNIIFRLGARSAPFVVSVIFILTLLIAGLVNSYSPSVNAAPNTNLNFQARLLTDTGALVPDGNYHVEFKLYDSLASGASTQGTCVGGATDDCLWVETRTTGNLVRVVNGYLTANLGSLTSFPSTIDWSEELWLTMNIGGTGAVSWDGEMTPRLELTAVPYAFEAAVASNLVATDSGNTTTVGILTPTTDRTINFPDDSGTVCLTSGNCIGAGGSGDILDGGQTGAISIGTTDNTVLSLLQNSTVALTVNSSQLLQFNAYDCTGNTNGGALTADASGNIICSDDDGGGGGAFSGILLAADSGTAETLADTNTLSILGGSNISTISSSADTITISVSSSPTFTGDLQVDGNTILGSDSSDTLAVNATSTFNAGLVVAAGQSITLTGGNTASRPGSPTEGMIYFDTDTDSLLTYANGKWQSDRTTATIIIAATDSTQAAKDSADIVVNGTSDETEINTALTAAAGGRVYLLPGTYTIDGSIVIPSNTELAGSGSGTVVTIPDSHDANLNFIVNSDTGGGNDNITVRDLVIDGNGTNQASGGYSIFFDNIGSGSGTTAILGLILENVTMDNVLSSGYNLFIVNTPNSYFNNLTLEDDVWLQNVDDSTFTNNRLGIDLQIYLTDNSTFSGNTIGRDFISNGSDNNVVFTSNNADSIIWYGSNSVISNNTVGYIHLYGDSASESHTVTGNNVGGQIYLDDIQDTLISDNRISDTSWATGNNAIYLTDSDNNSITGNHLTDTSCTTTCYAINISDASSDDNYLANNTYTTSGADQATINDAGTNTVYASQTQAGNTLQSGSTILRAYGTQALTGSIDPIASTTITGVGTKFLTELQIGDRITVSGETRTVIGIASDISLTVDIATTNTANDAMPDRLPAALLVQDSTGVNTVRVNDIGSVVLQNSTDSTTSFQVLDANGGTPILNVDTISGRVGIGTASPNAPLHVINEIRAQRNGGGNLIRLYFPSANEQRIEATAGSTFSIASTSGGGIIGLETGGSSTRQLTVNAVGLVTINSGTLSVGEDSQAGTLAISDGAATANYATIDVSGALGSDYTVSIPVISANDTFCLVNEANCAGVTTLNSESGALSIAGVAGETDISVSSPTISVGLPNAVTVTTSLIAPTLNATTALQTAGTTRITNTGVLQNVTNADAGTFFTGGTLANARLVNSGALTVTAGTGLTNGGAVSLGGSTTIDLADTAVTPGTYGDATNVAQFAVDQQGRITGASEVAITGLDTCSTCISLQASTPGSAQTGHINITGTVIAGNFSGNGSALTSLDASNLSSGTVASGRLTGSYTGITGLGTVTVGVWNGTALTNTYVSDTLTVDSGSSVAWAALNSYPAACSAGDAITALGDSVTCSTFATTDTTYTAGDDLDLAGTVFSIESQLDSVSVINRDSATLTLQTTTSGSIFINAATTFNVNSGELLVNASGNVSTTGELTVTQLATFNGGLEVAAGESITLNGGNTASRPGSPTEGMIYFDSDTDTLLTYSNGKWKADSGEYIIVAANDSTQAEKDSAHYVADGTDDQVEINTALTQAAGGKVLLLAGTFVVHQTNDGDATIFVPNNTTLAGVGPGTLIELGDIDATDSIIENTDQTTGTNVIVRDLSLDGRQDLNTAPSFQFGIFFRNLGDVSTGSPGGSILNIKANDFKTAGVTLFLTDNSIVSSSVFTAADVQDNNVFNNNNNIYGNYVHNGEISSSSKRGIVSGNEVVGGTGIFVSGDNSQVTNNAITDASSAGIAIGFSSDVLVSGNQIHNSGGSTSNGGIELSNSTGAVILNNHITDTSCTVTCYAISVDGGSTSVYLSGNTFTGSGADDAIINDAGTGTIYAGQVNDSSTGNYLIQPTGAIELLKNTNITGDLSVSGTSVFTGLATFNGNLVVSGAEDTSLITLTDTTNADSVGVYTGDGSPEGVVTAQLGSIYSDHASGVIYNKASGDGTNTGWAILGSGGGSLDVAKMTRDAVQSIPHGANTKIAFDTEEFDIGGIADSVTNDRFTIVKPGRYKISAGWEASGIDSGERVITYISKNGSVVANDDITTAGSNRPVYSEVSIVLDLVASDYLEMEVFHGEGAAMNTGTVDAEKPRMTVVQIDGATGSGGGSLWTSSGSDVYFNTGNVGVGTAGPGNSKLSVVNSTSNTSGNNQGIQVTTTQTVASGNTTHGQELYTSAAHTSGSQQGIIGINNQLRFTGNGGTTSYASYYNGWSVVQNGHTVNELTGLIIGGVLVEAGGTVDTWYGARIGAPTATGTLTNSYALVTEPGSGNVGIGTTTPDSLLQVDGGVKVSGSGDLTLQAFAADVGDLIFIEANDNQKGRIWVGTSAGQEELYISTGDNTPDLTINSSGDTTIAGSLTVASSTTDGVLNLYDVDDSVSDQLRFYNGVTRIGEIGTEDSTWLRINQETAKNIYTPRKFVANDGLFSDSNFTYGIASNGSLQALAGSVGNSELIDAVTFSTVNTGQGNNELYDMNQNVLTTSSVTHNRVRVANGSAGAPSFAFTSDTDTGFYTEGSNQGRFYFSSYGAAKFVLASSTFAPIGDNARDLGTVSSSAPFGRYRTVYRVAESSSSDINFKKNIDYDSLGIDFINDLTPASWNWNDVQTADDGRQWQGLIAQNVGVALLSNGFSDPVDWAGYLDEGGGSGLALNYEMFIGPIIQSVQEVDLKVESNISRIEDLETAAANSNTKVNLAVTDTATIKNLVVVDSVSITNNLTVSGITTVQNLVVEGHITSGGNTPVIANGTDLGVGDITTIDGNDIAGTITIAIDAGSTPVLGELVGVTFDEVYASVPRISLTALNADSLDLPVYIEKTVNGFVLKTNSVPVAGLTYTFDYIIIE